MQSLDELDKLDWDAVHGSFPWSLVAKIGVGTAETKVKVEAALTHAAHRPPVAIEPGWYF